MMKVLEYSVKVNLIHLIWECPGWLSSRCILMIVDLRTSSSW